MFNFGGNSGGGSSKINSKKKLAIVTGTTSGLGKQTARSLIDSGEHFVVCACRDVAKMESVAEANGWDKSSYKVMELDLASYDSTRKFHRAVKTVKSKPLDALVCNAAVYQPALPTVSHEFYYSIFKHIQAYSSIFKHIQAHTRGR
jgi:NAD(P)-dependent dehydrogenase (short-subunit alcohol dehydrogenase family)